MTVDIDRMLDEAVAAGRVPGVVAMAADDRGSIYEAAFGRRSLDDAAPMTTDTVFWLASMTKALTSVAALQAVEEGLLELDGTLGHLVPELAAPRVLEGFDADGRPLLRPARRQPSLRELLTHTAGYGYHMWNESLRRYMELTGVPATSSGLRRALSLPMVADPGERWEYGIGVDLVGQAVEAVRRKRLGEVLAERVTGPLGMADTAFRIGADQRQRLAAMHARAPDGRLATVPFEVRQDPEFESGGGGLYGSAPDYLRFLRMILGGGELEGVRILSPQTVAAMARDQTRGCRVTPLRTAVPALSNDVELLPGTAKSWGLASMLNDGPAATGRSGCSLAWAGLANTYYWVDPTRHVCGLIMTQILPFADAAVLRLFERFEAAVYRARPSSE